MIPGVCHTGSAHVKQAKDLQGALRQHKLLSCENSNLPHTLEVRPTGSAHLQILWDASTEQNGAGHADWHTDLDMFTESAADIS